MKTSLHFAVAVFLAMVSISSVLSAKEQEYRSKPGQQQKTLIKSLSSCDIAPLTKGQGWELANVAELNGMPAPLHLLEMKNSIHLTKKQIKKISAIYDEMTTKTLKLDHRLIQLKEKLNNEFRHSTITDKKLKNILSSIADTQKERRYRHLLAHLSSRHFLTTKQVNDYYKLRDCAATALRRAVIKGDASSQVTPNDDLIFFYKSILADKITLTSQSLIYIKKECFEYGNEDITGFREKVCVRVQTDIRLPGLNIIKASDKRLFSDAELIIKSEINRKILNGKTLSIKERQALNKIFDPEPTRFDIPLRDGIDPEEVAEYLKAL